MPSRGVFYSQTLTTVDVSVSTYVAIKSLTFTNAASAAYLMGGSWAMTTNITANNNFIQGQLMYNETAATATICDFGFRPYELAGPLDNETLFGFRRIVTPTSAGTMTIKLYGRTDTAQTMGRFTDVRLWAIEMTAADAYGESYTVDKGIAGSTWRTVCSASLFPASHGEYLVMGYADARVQAGSARPVGIQILHQTTAGNFGRYQNSPNSIDAAAAKAYSSFAYCDIISMAVTANNIDFRIGTSAATSAVSKGAAIACLRASTFNAVFGAATDATANTSSATYVTALSLTTTFSNNFRYGILAAARSRCQSQTISQFTNFVFDGVTATNIMMENTGTAANLQNTWQPSCVFIMVTGAGRSYDMNFRRRTETPGTGVDLANQRIIVMQLDTTAGVVDTPTNWWYFEEDGDALDGSANADTLTRTTATRTATHKQGTYAANFASGDYFSRTWANLSAQFILKNSTTSFSVGCWVQFTTVGADRTIWTLMDSAGPNYAGIDLVYRTASATVRGEMNVGGVFYAAIAPTTVTTGVWYHFCFVWDGGSIVLYQDGAPGAKVAAGATAPTITENLPFFVGIWDLSLTPFIGIIDELFIYRNSALSKDDVSMNYSFTEIRLFRRMMLITS